MSDTKQATEERDIPEDVEEYTTAREDFAKIIAQEVSGLKGAIPEDDDYNMADAFIKAIDKHYGEDIL